MSKPSISNYDKFPVVQVSDRGCEAGWAAIAQRLKRAIRADRFVVCVECYPGCYEDQIEAELVQSLQPQNVIRVSDCYLPEKSIEALTARDLGDDPVFAFMNNYELTEFLDETKLAAKRVELNRCPGLVLGHRYRGNPAR